MHRLKISISFQAIRFRFLTTMILLPQPPDPSHPNPEIPTLPRPSTSSLIFLASLSRITQDILLVSASTMLVTAILFLGKGVKPSTKRAFDQRLLPPQCAHIVQSLCTSKAASQPLQPAIVKRRFDFRLIRIDLCTLLQGSRPMHATPAPK
jgi:hypothetical protein